MKILDKFKILTYNIGIINKPASAVIENGINQGDIVWLKHKYKDRFFADPFVINDTENELYILCEELSFWDNKGVISLLIVNKSDFSLKEKKVLIDEPWHLSFPYVIHDEFILPESHKGGKAILYHLDKCSWKIDEKHLICDECGFNDPILINTSDGEEVLLSTDNLSEKLYIFKRQDDGKYIRSGDRPLLIDKSKSRAAGNAFYYKDSLVRPVQDCNERYGRQTRIEKILHLDMDHYETETISVLNSDLNPPFDETFHTFNCYDDYIIVDGSKDVIRFPMKVIYRLYSKLFR